MVTGVMSTHIFVWLIKLQYHFNMQYIITVEWRHWTVEEVELVSHS